MAETATIVVFPEGPGAPQFSGRPRECVACGELKSHTVENFRPCLEQRSGKPYGYIKRICRACEHLKRTEQRQKHERSARAPLAPRKYDVQRRHNLKKNYNITPEQYDVLLQAQGHRCAVCRTDTNGTHQSGRPRHFAVDHDHRTGEVRGLLCTGCNTGVGALKDNPAMLRAAADYLERRNG